ncbi:unnamed protein product [Thlaspi arvense]|uniref:F-box domain-containing protein n=1 Tax=Thlaspi arvense TaxID=13288 RepID=A0AAU9S822_THLAR|nr:unnamed protein product [Thlaspi arvense]
MCRKQPGIAIGRLCEKCDGKCVICDSYVRPCTLVRICDECNYGSFQGRCVICGGVGISDAYYCKECTQQEKDRDGCPKIVNLGSAKTDLFYERKKDLVSNLPDEILGKTLSLLPTRLAASTSVLSKRWTNLLALVDNLDFDDDASVGRLPPPGFPEFVEKTLALLCSDTCPTLKRFSLKFRFQHESCLVKSWIRTALERGCLELHLENVGWDNIPTQFFTSNTLVKLTISKGFYSSDRCLADDSSGRRKRRIFPSLKTLSIVSMMFPDFETYQYLINGCPVLEDLSLHFHEKTFPPNWSGGVLCPSVKRMNIYHYFPSLP